MKNYSVNQTSLCFLLATFLLLNTAVFSPMAGADTSGSTDSSQPAPEASPTTNTDDANVPDDQLALPISLKQFQNLQAFVQKHTEENVKAIDALTKDSEEFTKNFNTFVDDLLKEPAAAPAA